LPVKWTVIGVHSPNDLESLTNSCRCISTSRSETGAKRECRLCMSSTATQGSSALH
jgi:hypothetical protein